MISRYDFTIFKYIELITFFYENIDINESKLFFIKDKNKRHNIFGLWSLDLIEHLENDLSKGMRKVELWADSIGVKIINLLTLSSRNCGLFLSSNGNEFKPSFFLLI